MQESDTPLRPEFVLRLRVAADGNPHPEQDPRMVQGADAFLTDIPSLAGERFWEAFDPNSGDDAKKARHAINRAIQSHQGSTLSVSRGMSRLCTPATLKCLEKFLRSRCKTIRVEIHLCRPERHMAFHFIRQLEHPSGNWRIPNSMPTYQKLLERFERAFRRHTILYQIQRDCDVLNPPIPYPVEAVSLLYAYRSYCWFHRGRQLSIGDHRAVFEALASIGEEPFGFSTEAVRAGMRYRGKDIEWLETRLSEPLPEEGAEPGIRSGEELLRRSVEATRLLAGPPATEEEPLRIPRTAREAAGRLVDFIHRQFPDGVAPGGPFSTAVEETDAGHLTRAGLLAMEESPACYIHVGMPKTGTTSIQDALSSFRPANDFEYLKIRPANHSRLIFTLFAETPERLPYYRKLGLGPEAIAPIRADFMRRLQRQVTLNRSRKLIISGETIFQLGSNDLRKMADFFQSQATRVRIIIYLRPIQSFIESVFQQRLKRGMAVERFEAVYPDYAKRIRAFDEAFGEENVILRPFDRAHYPNGDVVVDFCQLSGIALHDYLPAKLNESMCTEAIAVLYAFHHFGGSTGIGEESMNLAGEFVELLQTLEGKRFTIAGPVVERVVKAHEDDMQWIENRAGFPLASSSGPAQPHAIRSLRKLLARSMEGARMLIEATAEDFPHTGPLPATPREVAGLVRDYLLWKRPDLPITLGASESKE